MTDSVPFCDLYPKFLICIHQSISPIATDFWSSFCVIWHTSSFSPRFCLKKGRKPFLMRLEQQINQLKGQVYPSGPVSGLCWIFFLLDRQESPCWSKTSICLKNCYILQIQQKKSLFFLSAQRYLQRTYNWFFAQLSVMCRHSTLHPLSQVPFFMCE